MLWSRSTLFASFILFELVLQIQLGLCRGVGLTGAGDGGSKVASYEERVCGGSDCLVVGWRVRDWSARESCVGATEGGEGDCGPIARNC